MINLAACWGLGPERGVESITTEARGCVVQAEMRRTSFRGVVDVVSGGDTTKKDPANEQATKVHKVVTVNGKRKAEVEDDQKDSEKAISKRQMKRMAKKARTTESQPDP